MKRLQLILVTFIMAYSVNAQITMPRLSPPAKMVQKVGLTDVELEYQLMEHSFSEIEVRDSRIPFN